jgi:hypothetical protein
MMTLSMRLPSLQVYLADSILNGTGNAGPFKTALTSGLFCGQYFE